MVSTIEAFSEKTTKWSILEALLFAVISFLLGWIYDKAIYYKNKAELSESRLWKLLKYSPEPIIVYQNEKIVFANDKFEELVQFSSTQVIGNSIFQYVLQEYHPIVRKRLLEMCEVNPNLDRIELKIQIKHNQVLDVEVSSAPIVFNNKPAVEVFLRDVTKRNRLEDELRKNEELYRFITENTTDLISYLNPNGVYEYFSPSCSCMLDYKQEELIGKNLFEYLHPEEVEKVTALLLKADSDLDFASFTHRLKKNDGTYIWVETNARTIREFSKAGRNSSCFHEILPSV